MLGSDTLIQRGVGVNWPCGGASIGGTCMVFCAEVYQAVSNDTSILTCSYDSSDNTVSWEDEVPLCLVVTWDVLASLRVDFTECFSLTFNETCVVRCTVFYTLVGDKNTTECMGDNDGHFQGSLECAEESLKWDGVAEDDDVDDDSLAFPWDPGRALSTESDAGTPGNLLRHLSGRFGGRGAVSGTRQL